MNLDASRIFSKRVRLTTATLLPCLLLYVGITFFLFYKFVIPSLNHGTTSDDFAVDSTVYIYFAETLRKGIPDPWVIGSLTFFPNTVWTPVFISYFVPNPLLVMFLNYAMVIGSVLLLKRSLPISLTVFLPLLLLNPTTTTSILCVNKEVIDLVVLSMFLYGHSKRNRVFLVAALCLAMLNRYELCIVILIFEFAVSRFNPFRRRRWLTLITFVCALDVFVPLFSGNLLAHRFEEAEFAGTVRLLDMLQMKYLYVVALVPKLAEEFFGQLLNPQVWKAPSSWLLINFFNNFASAFVIVVNVWKRRLTLRNDLLYFGALGSVFVAQALVIQPRYFYWVYVLLCLQAAWEIKGDGLAVHSNPPIGELQHA